MILLADRLAWARRAAGLSQRRLSALAGLTGRHVCSLEDGRLKGNLRATTAGALARVLGIRVGWLVFGEGVRPSAKRIAKAAAKFELKFERDQRRAARRLAA